MKKLWILSAVWLLPAGAQTTNYTVANIVTNTQDSRLVNPWGLSRPLKSSAKENEWWTSDQVTGLSTLYDANGSIVALQVSIPPSPTSGNTVGSPTGTAFNANNFAFATLDGTISNWFAGNNTDTGSGCAKCHVQQATIMVDHYAAGASYQGLTVATNATSHAATYYAANANGGIEAYDAASFAPVSLPAGAFTDAKLPAGYTPAGIQAIGAKIYVTYNLNAGGGTGFVDVYNTNGKLLMRLQSGSFNQPWGVALAPANFGQFSSMVLVGNTGNGTIGAYSPSNGKFQGLLQSGSGPLAIPGLWGLVFGNGNTESGPTNVLYFNAGGANLTTGVFGAISAP